MDELRGTPMSVGNLEEIIDDNHAIVSTSVGSEHYVSILSFVDKDQLEPGCSVLLNHKVCENLGSAFLLTEGPAMGNRLNERSQPFEDCLVQESFLYLESVCLVKAYTVIAPPTAQGHLRAFPGTENEQCFASKERQYKMC